MTGVLKEINKTKKLNSDIRTALAINRFLHFLNMSEKDVIFYGHSTPSFKNKIKAKRCPLATCNLKYMY